MLRKHIKSMPILYILCTCLYSWSFWLQSVHILSTMFIIGFPLSLFYICKKSKTDYKPGWVYAGQATLLSTSLWYLPAYVGLLLPYIDCRRLKGRAIGTLPLPILTSPLILPSSHHPNLPVCHRAPDTRAPICNPLWSSAHLYLHPLSVRQHHLHHHSHHCRPQHLLQSTKHWWKFKGQQKHCCPTWV